MEGRERCRIISFFKLYCMLLMKWKEIVMGSEEQLQEESCLKGEEGKDKG